MNLQPTPTTGTKRQPVQATAERLRERIFASPPNQQIGSLPDLAKEFGVGIVTVQQAARILEHEGLLEVRRGPGGGYYGRRPDLSDLERLMGAYMRGEPTSWKEVLDITSLLFNELCAAAARCTDASLQEELRGVAAQVARCSDSGTLGQLETALQNVLFRMVNRPLFELLTRVALGFAETPSSHESLLNAFGLEQWKDGRRRIIEAILSQDPELAHFEANRLNRRVLVSRAGLQEY